MASIDERMNTIMLKIVQRRSPEAGVEDFTTAIWDLDLDSLDVAELTELLEKEFGVEADLERLDECVSPADIKTYFLGLIGTP